MEVAVVEACRYWRSHGEDLSLGGGVPHLVVDALSAAVLLQAHHHHVAVQEKVSIGAEGKASTAHWPPGRLHDRQPRAGGVARCRALWCAWYEECASKQRCLEEEAKGKGLDCAEEEVICKGLDCAEEEVICKGLDCAEEEVTCKGLDCAEEALQHVVMP